MPEPKITQLPKTAALAAAALIGPLAALLTGFIKSHPLLAILFLIVYELLVAALGIVLSISRSLREIWTARLTSSVDAWSQRVFSRYRRSYMSYVRASNRHMDMKGLTTRGEYAVGVDSVFVNLALDSRSPQSTSSDPLQALNSNDRRSVSDIWSWLSRADRDGAALVIIGPPGSGKTTLLRHLALHLSSRRRVMRGNSASGKMPLLISLRDFKDRFNDPESFPTLEEVMRGTRDDPLSLASMIRTSLTDVQRNEPPGWVESSLESGRFLIMLDGLDEVGSSEARSRISKWVEVQHKAFPKCSLILTSRPFGYRSDPLDSATVVQVLPFTEAQVHDFIERWYTAICLRTYDDRDSAILHARRDSTDLLERLKETPELLELSVNPLLLTMVANVHFYRGALPGSRTELYSEVCEVFLGKRHQARGIELDLPAQKRQRILQRLAYKMMKDRVRDVTPAKAAAYIREILPRVAPEISAIDFLRQMEQSSGLVVERESGVFSFCHFTFQEYLTAVHVRENNLVQTLVSCVNDSWWRETIKLYAAQSDATPIIEACLSKLGDLYLLSLAVGCVEDAREVDPRAREALTAHLVGDVRTNRGRRRAAAGVKLFGRSRSFSRIGENVYVSRMPITCLEYQLFLDEYFTPPEFYPDHWPDLLYPEGQEDAPVLGLPQAAAQAFVIWLGSLYDDPWSYSLLPMDQDIDESLLGALRLDGIGAIHVDSYFDTAARSFRRSPSIPATTNYPRDYVDEGIPTVAPRRIPGWEPSQEIINSQLSRDGDEARRLAIDTYVPGLSGFDIGESARLDYLEALKRNSRQRESLLGVWRNVSSLDIPSTLRDADQSIQEVFARVYPLVETSSLGRKVADLGRICQALTHLLAIGMNASARARVDDVEYKVIRFHSRLLALAAASLCVDLAASGSVPRDRHPWLRRLLSVRSDEASDRTRFASLDSLSHHFEGLYCALALFEARATQAAPPWEGTFVFRGPSAPFS